MRKRILAALLWVAALVLLVGPYVSTTMAQITVSTASGIAELISNGTTITSTLPFLAPNGDGTTNGYGFATVPSAGMHLASSELNIGAGSAAGRGIKFNISGGEAWRIDMASSGSPFRPSATDTRDIGQSVRLIKDFFVGRSTQGAKSKALTEGGATSFVRVAVPQTAAANYGGGSVGYTVYATDGTDSQSLVGDMRFAMVNKAGTETCTPGEVGTPVLAESAGGSTLTCTFTCATAAADTVDVSANCTSSLVQTTFTIQDRGDMQQPNTWTPQ